MSNKSKITIPKPCQENWLEMNPDEKTRFCNLCQKNIFELEADDSNFNENSCNRYNIGLKSASQKRTTLDKISDFILKMRTK
jgi:hypothetical protein